MVCCRYDGLTGQDFLEHAQAMRGRDPGGLVGFLTDNEGKWDAEALYPVVRGVYDAEALLLVKKGLGEAAIDVVMRETERLFTVLKMAVRQSGAEGGGGKGGLFKGLDGEADVQTGRYARALALACCCCHPPALALACCCCHPPALALACCCCHPPALALACCCCHPPTPHPRLLLLPSPNP
jgi:hypothetical protein